MLSNKKRKMVSSWDMLYPMLSSLREMNIIEMRPYHSQSPCNRQVFLLASRHSVMVCEQSPSSNNLVIRDRSSRTTRFNISGAQWDSNQIDVYTSPDNPVGVIIEHCVYFKGESADTLHPLYRFKYVDPKLEGNSCKPQYKVLRLPDNLVVANLILEGGLVTFQFDEIPAWIKAMIISYGINRVLTTHRNEIMADTITSGVGHCNLGMNPIKVMST